MLVQLQQFTFEFVLDVNLAVFLKIKDKMAFCRFILRYVHYKHDFCDAFL